MRGERQAILPLAYCTHLEEIEIPNSVNGIGAYAFSGYNRLKKMPDGRRIPLYHRGG